MRAPRTLSPETLALLAAIPQSSEDVHLILRGLNPRRVWRALLCFCPEPAYLYWRSLLEQCNPYSDEPLLTAREICSIVFRFMAIGDDPSRLSSGHSSRSNSANEIAVATPVTSQQRQQADLTRLLQQREDYQSPISGVVDKRLMDINEDRYVEKRQKFKAGRCQAVHIFPLALGMMPEDDTSSDEACQKHLSQFCKSDKAWYTMTSAINAPSNAMLLTEGEHQSFRRFRLGFDTTTTANTYRVIEFDQYPPRSVSARMDGSRVLQDPVGQVRNATFVARRGIAVPDPELLALHFAFCQVFHASGMAELFNTLDDEEKAGMDGIKGLSDVSNLARLKDKLGLLALMRGDSARAEL